MAFAVAIVIALALPKRTECSYPGARCGHTGRRGMPCTTYQVEPLGFYLIELAVERNVGFAYETGEDCR